MTQTIRDIRTLAYGTEPQKVPADPQYILYNDEQEFLILVKNQMVWCN